MMRRSNFGDDMFDFRSMFERMNRQFEEMNRQFAQFAETPALEAGESIPAVTVKEQGTMQVDVAHYDGNVVVTADLPGFEKEDIDLSIAGDALTIRADAEYDSADESETYIRRERRRRSMRRTIGLPVAVHEDEASASYTNGVLTVTLPEMETEDEDSHRIDID